MDFDFWEELFMKHLGDITKISGYEVPQVDIICGGSPCQDLSVAGKRAGLAGERSGLFMEQIRIVNEMRERGRKDGLSDDDIRPRYMVWENVPGAFSSNKGEDFRAVLEETAKIADKNAIIPRLEGGQKWSTSGCILGDGWSIAWRVHDAQFWGVPQRRKRIALVADFRGQSAPEILFESKILPSNSRPSEFKRERIAGHSSESINKAIFDVRISSDGTKNWRAHCYETNISRALDTGGENPDSNHGGVTIITYKKKGHPQNAENGQGWEETNINDTLNAFDSGEIRTPTLIAQEEYVRRLTPMECERLQGYPDHWTDIGEWIDSKGKKHKGDSDSPRYKALGNSIALPFWQWMAERMCSYLKEPSMASLFDGIGGFPLAFSRVGCKPIWASEIEEFPMAVTKLRFPEGENKNEIYNTN